MIVRYLVEDLSSLVAVLLVGPLVEAAAFLCEDLDALLLVLSVLVFVVIFFELLLLVFQQDPVYLRVLPSTKATSSNTGFFFFGCAAALASLPGLCDTLSSAWSGF